MSTRRGPDADLALTESPTIIVNPSGAFPASVKVSRFVGASGVSEHHIMVRPNVGGAIGAQLGCVFNAYRKALESLKLDMNTAVLRRFFCSDLPNQAAALAAHPFSNPRNPKTPCAVSWVCQPPRPPVKVGLWAYHVSDPGRGLDKTREGATLTLRRGEISHHWTTGLVRPKEEDSYSQTKGILEDYEAFLRSRGLTLADNVIRTWFYVRNVDVNYQGFVAARRELFSERGLTPETHYIASTGIEGGQADVAARVGMDAYAISGVRPEQIEYLAALDHLSPTHVYGVTFERATAVSWRDRKHVFISGTASIDRDGNIVHPGDVSRQLDRTIENIGALLEKAGASFEDMCIYIVYVRDPSDVALARQKMRDRFGPATIEVVVAPVCRPGWLIEVEGIAIVPASNPELPAF